MTHRLTLTIEELQILEEVLAHIDTAKQDVQTIIRSRNLYGRIITLHARAARLKLYRSALGK